jgi:hypothetical protein
VLLRRVPRSDPVGKTSTDASQFAKHERQIGHGTGQRLGESVPSVFSHIAQGLGNNDLTSQDGRLFNCGQAEEIKESDSGCPLP